MNRKCSTRVNLQAISRTSINASKSRHRMKLKTVTKMKVEVKKARRMPRKIKKARKERARKEEAMATIKPK